MFAKNTELLLMSLCQKCDVSRAIPDDFIKRFESLRDYGRLPRGRENRHKVLTASEIAAAILALTCVQPGWAGHASIVLSNLRSVGGSEASFFGTLTLQDSIACILTDAIARKAVIRLTVSLAESGTNSHGYAALLYEKAGTRQRVFYAGRNILSVSATEETLESLMLHSPVSREVAFNRAFFVRIAREIDRARALPAPPAGDGSEYNSQEAKDERYRKLGVVPGSRFLNIGVDNQVTWPNEETLVQPSGREGVISGHAVRGFPV